MKRLVSDLLKFSVGVNCGDGLQVISVVKLLKEGGILLWEEFVLRSDVFWCDEMVI